MSGAAHPPLIFYHCGSRRSRPTTKPGNFDGTVSCTVTGWPVAEPRDDHLRRDRDRHPDLLLHCQWNGPGAVSAPADRPAARIRIRPPGSRAAVDDLHARNGRRWAADRLSYVALLAQNRDADRNAHLFGRDNYHRPGGQLRGHAVLPVSYTHLTLPTIY